MMTDSRPLRFGLVGTGHWARITHAPALASTEDLEFAGVWGRNATAAGTLAEQFQVTAYRDIAALLADVDAVAFSVPPDVQAALAIRAASAGKHLLLEKPLALSEAAADALAESVEQARVASVVFFTTRFQPEVRTWLADVARQGGWAGGCAVWLGSALQRSSPFNTPWRRDQGALWDLAPHAVSLLWASLGPVASVTADAGPGDVTCLVLHHDGGATSTVMTSLAAADPAADFSTYLWGEAGRSAAPAETSDAQSALRVALGELADNARTGRLAHPCDVAFGRAVGRVLAQAQRQLEAAGLR